MISFEFINEHGEGILTGWRLEKPQRRALERKMDQIRQMDRRMAAGSALYHQGDGIWEVEIRGNVQLRPRACFGPDLPDDEVTFLATATKRDNQLIPRNVDAIAADNLRTLRISPDRRKKAWPLPENG